MLTFLKAQAAAFTATASDYVVTYLCVSIFGFWYLAGSVAGTVVGGVINFYMGRKWVFNAENKNLKAQILKYVLVWCGNLAIVTGGIYLLTHYFNVNYMISKLIISGVIGTLYNYFMQKKFIFTQ